MKKFLCLLLTALLALTTTALADTSPQLFTPTRVLEMNIDTDNLADDPDLAARFAVALTHDAIDAGLITEEDVNGSLHFVMGQVTESGTVLYYANHANTKVLMGVGYGPKLNTGMYMPTELDIQSMSTLQTALTTLLSNYVASGEYTFAYQIDEDAWNFVWNDGGETKTDDQGDDQTDSKSSLMDLFGSGTSDQPEETAITVEIGDATTGTFHAGVSFGMGYDEVEKRENDAGNRTTDQREKSTSTMDMTVSDIMDFINGQSVSGYYYFDNDQLYQCHYEHFTSDGGADVTNSYIAVENRLEELYGPSTCNFANGKRMTVPKVYDKQRALDPGVLTLVDYSERVVPNADGTSTYVLHYQMETDLTEYKAQLDTIIYLHLDAETTNNISIE